VVALVFATLVALDLMGASMLGLDSVKVPGFALSQDLLPLAKLEFVRYSRSAIDLLKWKLLSIALVLVGPLLLIG
jgi:hypothetical protein